VPFGRLLYTVDALPAVRPAPFTLQDDALVIFAHRGEGLADIADDTVVAFQADAIDVSRCEGWSVTVIGHGTAVSDQAEADALYAARPVHCHVPEPVDVFRLSIERVDGRRVGEQRSDPPVAAGSDTDGLD